MRDTWSEKIKSHTPVPFFMGSACPLPPSLHTLGDHLSPGYRHPEGGCHSLLEGAGLAAWMVYREVGLPGGYRGKGIEDLEEGEFCLIN